MMTIVHVVNFSLCVISVLRLRTRGKMRVGRTQEAPSPTDLSGSEWYSTVSYTHLNNFQWKSV